MRPFARRLCGAAALLALGCGVTEPDREKRGRALSSEEFVAIYVELRRAEREASTAEEFEARKQEVLARHGTTPERLIEFVQAHGRDVRSMAEVWDSIEAKLARTYSDTAQS